MAAATASAAFAASRRRLFTSLLSTAGAVPLDPRLSMRQPGRDGEREALPLVPASLTLPPAPVRWLTRATFGYTIPDFTNFMSLGSTDDARWQGWVAQQLAPASIDDSACNNRIAAANYTTLAMSPADLWARREAIGNSDYFQRMLPLNETECMTLVRQIYSRRQLFEVMTDFWHDHFSVYGSDYDGGPMFPAFDRDAIRPNVFGNFRTMLQATCESASMMYMLDLYTSYSGHPNENYARELMELHTLGAENYAGIVDDPDDDPSLPTYVDWEGKVERLQYVDDDVYEGSRVLTGWTISHSTYETRNDPNPGTFEFVQTLHDAGVKRVLHRNFSAGGGQNDGTKLFDMLSQHPGTAHFVAGKICRRFVGDYPAESLVQSSADLFRAQWQAPDQIAQVVAHVLASNEFKNSWGTKMKRPTTAAVSVFRATAGDFTPKPDSTPTYTPTEEFIGRLQGAGQRLFNWPAPNGYPDVQRAWSSTGALGMTLKLLPRLLEMHQTESYNNAYPLLIDIGAKTVAAFPDPQTRTAQAIIGVWCDSLLGYRPQPTFGIAIDFLRQNVAADVPLDIVTDHATNGQPDRTGTWNANDLSKHYTIARLRTAIALVLCSPEFLRR